MYLMLLDPSNKPVTAAGTVDGYLVIGPLPAGTSTIGKVDQGLGGASAWKVDGSAVTQPVSLDAAEYRARTPTPSASLTITAALQQLSAMAPAMTTHYDYRLCVPDTADTGVYLGNATHQSLLLPGREFVIRSTSLVGWYVKRGGTTDVTAIIYGMTNT